jgi:hypothetical protein
MVFIVEGRNLRAMMSQTWTYQQRSAMAMAIGQSGNGNAKV